MTGRATRVGVAVITALVVAASLDLASKPASAQPGGRVPSELWSEYPLDPAKGGTPPPVAGDEGAGVPPAGVDTGRPGETRPVEPATPQGEEDTLLASPLLWVLLLVLLLGSALVIAATRALPQAIESVTAMPARLRARDRLAGLRAGLSAPARAALSAPAGLARRATVDVPRMLSRLAVPAGAPARLVRRARRPMVAAPRRVEVPAEPRIAREDTSVADTLVERVRGYVAPAEKAPDVDKRPVVAAGVERCEIRWWRGYLKSQFYASAVTKEGVEVVVAMSPTFWWRHAEPPSPTKAAVAARMALVETLVAQGWRAEPTPHDPATPATWFAGRFRQRVRAKAHASA